MIDRCVGSERRGRILIVIEGAAGVVAPASTHVRKEGISVGIRIHLLQTQRFALIQIAS